MRPEPAHHPSADPIRRDDKRPVGVATAAGGARRGRWLPYALAAAAAFLIQAIVAFPGIMSWDSKDQYRQAVTGVYSDWFPPIMAQLWRLLLPVAPAGGGLLVLHLALYWGSFALIAIAMALRGRTGSGWVALAVGLAPPLVLLSIFIHKDVGHAVAIMAAFSLVLLARARGHRIGVVDGGAVVLLLAYAVLVRSNGVLAVGPVLLYAFWPTRRPIVARTLFVVAATGVMTLLSLPLASLVNNTLLGAKKDGAILSLVHYDLAGVAHYARDVSVYPQRQPTLATVDRCYQARMWDKLHTVGCREQVGFENGVKNKAKAIAWPLAMVHHPIAYAQHRLGHFNEELFAFVPARAWNWERYSDPRFDAVREPAITGAAERSLDSLADSPLFSPFVAFVLGLAVLGVLAIRADLDNVWREGAYVLTMAGTLYTLGYLIVGVAAMYRYMQFGLTAAYLGAVLLFVGTDRAAWRGVAWRLAAPTGVAMLVVTTARLVLDT